MQEMRTVPAPDAGAAAGYALGVARTRFRPGGHNLDLFSHGGGGYGFLSDLFWLPQLQLGIALLTNSDDPRPAGRTGRSGSSATWSPTRTAATTTACSRLPIQSDAVDPDGQVRGAGGPGRPDRGRRDAGVQPAVRALGRTTPSCTAPDSSAP